MNLSWNIQRRCSGQRSRARGRRSRARTRGLVLVLALVSVAMLSLSGFAFTESMLIERKAATLASRAAQTRLAVESGIEQIAAVLALPRDEREEWANLYDNPEKLFSAPVGTSEEVSPRFTVLVPREEETTTSRWRFGLANESAKLNLGRVLQWDRARAGQGRESLMCFPGITLELADALLDWMDADDQPREFGAERAYYEQLPEPRRPANRPPRSLEELLEVRGMTARLLWGFDQNRNGQLDDAESAAAQQGAAELPSDFPQGGCAHWWTCNSAERARDQAGRPRIELNQPDLARLHEQISRAVGETWATVIVAFRQFGAAPPAQTPVLGPVRATRGKLDFARPARFRLNSLFDLVDLRVQASWADGKPPTLLTSPWSSERTRLESPEVLEVWDRFTVDDARPVEGRVNVFLAPREVLAAVRGLDESTVEAIVSKRESRFDPLAQSPSTLAWLLEERIVPLERLRAMASELTTGGDVWRAQVVGFVRRRPGQSRVEVVWDATRRPVAVLDYIDMNRLGLGLPAELLRGAESEALPR